MFVRVEIIEISRLTMSQLIGVAMDQNTWILHPYRNVNVFSEYNFRIPINCCDLFRAIKGGLICYWNVSVLISFYQQRTEYSHNNS